MAKTGKADLLRNFSRVAQARQAIVDKTLEIYEMYMDNIKLAQAEGNFEVAQKSLEWLMLHAPADKDGLKVVDQDLDKPKQVEAKGSGPQINIGFRLGGINKPLALPSVIEVNDDDDQA